jgi:hypothetical protein
MFVRAAVLLSGALLAAGASGCSALEDDLSVQAKGCPVTKANGATPPGEAARHGNDELWTVFDREGVLSGSVWGTVHPDGSVTIKFPWWRAVRGSLRISGTRIDGTKDYLKAHVPEGYGLSGFQASDITFSHVGCWRVRGQAGKGSLEFVLRIAR